MSGLFTSADAASSEMLQASLQQQSQQFSAQRYDAPLAELRAAVEQLQAQNEQLRNAIATMSEYVADTRVRLFGSQELGTLSAGGLVEKAQPGEQMAATPHTGDIILSSQDSAPPGWLKCDGSEKSKSDYPNLYAVLGAPSEYGEATSADKFRLPDTYDLTADNSHRNKLFARGLRYYIRI